MLPGEERSRHVENEKKQRSQKSGRMGGWRASSDGEQVAADVDFPAVVFSVFTPGMKKKKKNNNIVRINLTF